MRILGIDPGLATVGIGIVEAKSSQDIQVIEWLTIQTAAGEAAPDRLQEIASDLREVLQEHKPEKIVIEKLYFSVNEKTAMDVAQARGVLLATAAELSVPIVEITPNQLKSCITGDGNADKKQVQDMLVRILNLDEIPQPDDAADALALAVYGGLVGDL